MTAIQEMRALHVRRLAFKATKIGAKGAFLTKYLAKKHLANCERDAHTAVEHMVKTSIFPTATQVMQVYWIRLPLKCVDARMGKLGSEVIEHIPAILPWDVLSVLHHRGVLENTLAGSQGKEFNERLWSNGMTCGWAREHPIVFIDEHLRKDVFGLHLFIDDVKTFNSQGQDACFAIVSWAGAAAAGVSKHSRFLICQIPTWRWTPRTNEYLAKAISWMVRIMMTGARPKFGLYGEPRDATVLHPYTPVYFAGCKSDWAQRAKMHLFSRHAGCNLCCERDLADKRCGLHTYADFSAAPAWAATSFTHDSLWMATPRARRSPWFREMMDIGFVLTRHFWDPMHLLFKKGLASDVCGSTLLELCQEEHGPAPTTWDNFREWLDRWLLDLFEEYMSFLRKFKIVHHRLAPFNSRRICKTEFRNAPTITDNYKCGDCKSMLIWLSYRCTRKLNRKVKRELPLADHECRRAYALHHLASFVKCMSQYPAMMSVEQGRVMGEHLQQFFEHYAHLVTEAVASRLPLWKVRPKAHGMHHIALDLLGGSLENPKQHSCWGEESLCGLCAKVTKRCHSSTAMYRAAQRFIGAMVYDMHVGCL